MKNKSFKKTALKYIPLVTSVLFMILACTISLFGDSYAVDSFCFDIHNYNTVQNDNNPTVLNIEKVNQDKPELYSGIYSNYKYNRTINGIRMMIGNNVETNYNGYLTKPSFFFQNTSSIANELDKYNTYSVDDGLFSSYFSPDELGNNYRSNRGCKCFAYISDTLAYKLIHKNDNVLGDYSSEKDDFLQLINGEDHVLSLKVDNEEISCSINSVLYSKVRSANRVNQLYGDFILIFNFQFYNVFRTSVEFDLKQGMYANRNLINTLRTLGIYSGDYRYLISTYDSKTNSYLSNIHLTNQAVSIMVSSPNKSLDVFYWLFTLLIIPSYLLFGYFEKTKVKKFAGAVILTIFLIFNLVTNFTYVYYAFTPPIIVFVIVSIISMFKWWNPENKNAQNASYFEIGI